MHDVVTMLTIVADVDYVMIAEMQYTWVACTGICHSTTGQGAID